VEKLSLTVKNGSDAFRNLTAKDVIDGGAGTDTLAIAGGTTLSETDYALLGEVKGIDNLVFKSQTGSATAVDGARLSGFATVTFDSNNAHAISKVAATQTIAVADGSATILAKDYNGDTAGTVFKDRVFGGDLNVTTAKGADVTVKAANATVKVAASAAAAADTTINGDVKTLSVNLTNATNAVAARTTATDYVVAVEATAVNVASVTINASGTSTNAAATTELQALTSLTLSGDGSAVVVGGNKLATIDASALGGTYAVGAGKGAATFGLHYTTDGMAADKHVAETVKLGSAVDYINATNSTYGAGGDVLDTIVGLKLDGVVATGQTTPTLVTLSSDRIDLGGGTWAKYTAVTEGASLGATLAAAAAAGTANYVFQLNGDTYAYIADNATLDATDKVVKFAGKLDLDLLKQALENTGAITGSAVADRITGDARANTITGGAGADVLTGAGGADTFVIGAGDSLVATRDTITDFNVGGSDVLKFAVAQTVRAADATALVAGTNVQQSAGGLVTFHANDNTLALKIAAIQADAELDAVQSIAIFQDGGNTYVYSAGAATGNADDQIIQLTGVSLNTITGTGTTDITLSLVP
jgi:Ca2+-binding RTX toxin-like protein